MRLWLLSRLRRSERGATAVEYGLMVALIAAVIIASVAFLGQGAQKNLQCTGDTIGTRTAQC